MRVTLASLGLAALLGGCASKVPIHADVANTTKVERNVSLVVRYHGSGGGVTASVDGQPAPFAVAGSLGSLSPGTQASYDFEIVDDAEAYWIRATDGTDKTVFESPERKPVAEKIQVVIDK